MAKKESTFLNMVLTLLLVTGIASFVLATVYNMTYEPIAMAREAKRQEAIQSVVPAFDNLEFERVMPPTGSDSLEFNYAYSNGQLVGVAVGTYTTQGFSGRITAMVGFYPDGRIRDVVHLEHKETPGLGDKIDKSKSDWSDQYQDLNPAQVNLAVTKDGGDVDAITAATITSRAYSDAIQRAYDTFKQHVINQEGGQPQ